ATSADAAAVRPAAYEEPRPLGSSATGVALAGLVAEESPAPPPVAAKSPEPLPAAQPVVMPPANAPPEPPRVATPMEPVTANPAGPGASEVRLVNNKRISLNYEVKDVGTSGVTSVELWCTRDGRTWKKKETLPHTQPPCVVEVEDEDLYGFT